MSMSLRASGRIGFAFIAIALMAVAIGGCGSHEPLAVPLAYRPTDQLNVGAVQGVMNKSVSVTVVDKRQQANQIGQNVEKSTPVPVYAGSPTPPDFVRDVLTTALNTSGVNVASLDAAQRSVVVELTRFWVNEGNTYSTAVAATVRVLPAGGGAPLWEGQVTGTNERFGRSLSTSNYQETLSDATLQMAGKLISNPGFREALK